MLPKDNNDASCAQMQGAGFPHQKRLITYQRPTIVVSFNVLLALKVL
jgi:hypothetical protein